MKGKIMEIHNRISVNAFSFNIIINLLFFAFDMSSQVQDKTGNSKSWFTSKQIAEKVRRIEDNGNDNIYLVEGDEQALLIDDGLGVADLFAYIKPLTNLPLIIVNTHAHPDHCGGDFQFDEVFIHPADYAEVAVFCNKKAHDDAVEKAKKEFPELNSSLLRIAFDPDKLFIK